MRKRIKLKYAKNKYLNLAVEIGRANTDESALALEKSYNKVFCIGKGKTGTTSLRSALHRFGLSTGNQPAAEMLSRECFNGQYDRLIAYCHTADAFQDAPFGHAGVFRILDEAFPNSKFILTIRETPEQWFDSLVRFHTKKFASNPSRPPTAEDLGNATYRYRGMMLENQLNGYRVPEEKLYDKSLYIKEYDKHNRDVISYFSGRPNDLLVLNVARPDSYKELADFLNVRGIREGTQFPWLNKT